MQDVFVLYYVPWCDHCKTFMTYWENFSKKVPNSLTLAIMDMTLNEIEGKEFEGYPALLYYPTDKKDGISFQPLPESWALDAWLE